MRVAPDLQVVGGVLGTIEGSFSTVPNNTTPLGILGSFISPLPSTFQSYPLHHI